MCGQACHSPARARLTLAAERLTHQDPVADFDTGHLATDGLDDAHALVAEDARQAERQRLVPAGEIGMTDPRGLDLDEDLIRVRVVELKCSQFDRALWGNRHGGERLLHRCDGPLWTRFGCQTSR